jgi:hypothetical protein
MFNRYPTPVDHDNKVFFEHTCCPDVHDTKPEQNQQHMDAFGFSPQANRVQFVIGVESILG